MKYLEVVNQNYHLQGFTTDGVHMYWSFTDTLVKTTMEGTVRVQVPVATRWEHLGGIDYHNGRIYAAGMARNPAWSSIHIYDAATLAVVDIIPLRNIVNDMNRGVDDNNGAGCITVGKDPATGEDILLVGCATKPKSTFEGQIVMQYDLKGNLQRKHIVPTGCTNLGIQNIDRDPDTGYYWMTAYGKGDEQHARETLYCVSQDLTTVLASYILPSSYGLHCCGGDRFYLSAQYGRHPRCCGCAYEVDMDYIRETAALEMEEGKILSFIRPLFDSEMGL